MARSIRIAVLVVSCMLAASVQVQAQPPPPPPKEPPPKENDCGALESAGTTDKLLLAGRCYEAAGKLASAAAAYKKAEAQATSEANAAVAKKAAAAATALEPKVSHITIQPTHRFEGLAITLDGAPVAAGGAAIPIDGGSHHIEATAPGRKPWSTDVTVKNDSDSQIVTVPELEAEAAPVAPEPPPVQQVAPPPTPAPIHEAPEEGMRDRQIAGITLLALGGAAIIAGAVLGGVALKKGSDAEEQCPGKVCPPGVSAVEVQSDIRPIAEASTMTLVMGSAAAVVGIAMLIVDAACGPDVTVGVSPLGLNVAGRF